MGHCLNRFQAAGKEWPKLDELQRTEINFLSAPEAEKIETPAPGGSGSRYSTSSAQREKRGKEGKRREKE